MSSVERWSWDGDYRPGLRGMVDAGEGGCKSYGVWYRVVEGDSFGGSQGDRGDDFKAGRGRGGGVGATMFTGEFCLV